MQQNNNKQNSRDTKDVSFKKKPKLMWKCCLRCFQENTAFRNDDLGNSLVVHWLGETGAQYLIGELRSWKLWGVAKKKKKKKRQFYASVSLHFIMNVLGFFSLDFSVFRVIYRLSLCNIIEEYETSCTYI